MRLSLAGGVRALGRAVHLAVFGLGALVVVGLALFVWPAVGVLLLAVVVLLVGIFLRAGRRAGA